LQQMRRAALLFIRGCLLVEAEPKINIPWRELPASPPQQLEQNDTDT